MAVLDATVVRAPVENVNDETVAVIRWAVENGAYVAAGEILVLAETTKTVFDIESPVAGYVWQVVEAGTDVPVGAVICYVGDTLEQAKAAASLPKQPAAKAAPVIPSPADIPAPASAPPVSAAPAVAPPPVAAPVPAATAPRFSSRASALVRQLGLDPALFAGFSLVREQDVRAVTAGSPQERQSAPAAPSSGAPRVEVPEVTPALGVAVRVDKLPRRKRVEIRTLRASAVATVMSSVSISVPTAGFFSRGHEATGQPGWASAVVIFEAARLLQRYPMFNGYYAEGDACYYEQVNVGYAVDAGNGLKVPVIREADRKSLDAIADEKQRFLVDYLSDALPVESLAGGTFTITDLSNEGVFHFQPLINEGQSAILGVCAEAFLPGAPSGTYNLVLTFDHQLAEGRTAAAFLSELRARLQAHEASLGERTVVARQQTARCVVCLRPLEELVEGRHYLVQTLGPGSADERQAVCTICLADW